MSAVDQLITDHLDTWSSVYKAKSAAGRGKSKLNLFGVRKLRELILELAVRGLLVPQDPSDEPASELLNKIAAEKAQLVKQGKIKKQKALLAIEDDEKPFELPEGWGWGRLGDLGIVASSSRVQKKEWQSSGIPFYRAREIVKLSKHGTVENELFIAEELFQQHSKKGFVPEAGDLMMTGVGTIGVPYVVPNGSKFYFKDASVLIFKNSWNFNPLYLFYFMKSPFWNAAIHDGSMGTTVHTLTIARANIALVPVAPIAEQSRIVAKVDELMAICDQLEQQQEAGITAHQILVQTLLDALTTASERDGFIASWARINDHFDTLFTNEWSIDQLKQTILQLAFMGKLVTQDANDEPASELLKKIAAEKAQLVKDGKIKKPKDLPQIIDDGKPAHLPGSWVCIRFGEVALVERGGSPRPIKSYITDDPDGLNWIKIGDTDKGGKYISSTQEKIRKEGLVKTRMVYPGDFLLTNSMSFGRPYITKIEGCIHDGWLRISPSEILNKDYLYWLLSSPHMYKALQASAAGAVVMNLNADKVRDVKILIPPLREQHRIVAKVDELMKRCDSLKSCIEKTQSIQLNLAEAVVEQALT